MTEFPSNKFYHEFYIGPSPDFRFFKASSASRSWTLRDWTSEPPSPAEAEASKRVCSCEATADNRVDDQLLGPLVEQHVIPLGLFHLYSEDLLYSVGLRLDDDDEKYEREPEPDIDVGMAELSLFWARAATHVTISGRMFWLVRIESKICILLPAEGL